MKYSRAFMKQNISTLRDSLHPQKGNFMISMTIAMLAMALVTLGLMRSNINTLNTAIGTSIGNQLSTINSALGSYIAANNAALIANTAITGVTTAKSPLISELQALNYLNLGVANTPTYGSAYNIFISVTPSGCTTTCQITGEVWLSNPIYTAANNPADIRLLGAAQASSLTGAIGYSLPQSPSLITGSGWTLANPDALNRPGILLAQTGLSSTASSVYWKAPVTTYTALPASGNSKGDGRVTLDTNRAFLWSGTAWTPVSVDQNGNLAVSGALTVASIAASGAITAGTVTASSINMTGATSTADLSLNSAIATSGNSCAGYSSGTIAKDSSGNIYVCK